MTHASVFCYVIFRTSIYVSSDQWLLVTCLRPFFLPFVERIPLGFVCTTAVGGYTHVYFLYYVFDPSAAGTMAHA